MNFWKRIPIPRLFFSEATGEPFATCLDCGKHLHAEGVTYVVEKAIRTYPPYDVRDTVFEYALCTDCYEQVTEAFSEESKQRMAEYQVRMMQPAMQERFGWLQEEGVPDIERWVSQCILKGTAREELSEYQIMALCMGEDMIVTYVPCLLGGPAMEEITALLSAETIDALNGFRDKHLDLPPDLKRTLGPDLVVF